MKKILYINHRNKTKVLNNFLDALGPDTLLYGYNFFLSDNNFITDSINHCNKKRYLFLDFLCTRVFYRFYRLSFKLGLIFENLKKINTFDIIFCSADGALFPILLLKRIGLIKRNIKIFGASIGLINNINGPCRKALIIWLLKRADSVIVYSLSEEKLFFDKLKLNNVKFINPGIDINFFNGEKYCDNTIERYVISIGNDSERDYKNLITAWSEIYKEENDFNIKLKIITSQNIILPIGYFGIEVINNKITIKEIRNYYSKMLFGIVPLRKTLRSSGQIAVLSMLSMKKNVVTDTNNAGLKDLSQYEGVINYDCENVDSLKKSIKKAIKLSEEKIFFYNREFFINYSTKNLYKNLKGIFLKA